MRLLLLQEEAGEAPGGGDAADCVALQALGSVRLAVPLLGFHT